MSTFDGHHVVIHADAAQPHNPTITIDGQPLKACRRLELRMEAGHKLPVVVFELYPGVLDVDLPDAVLAALEATREELALAERGYLERDTVDGRLMRLATQVDRLATAAEDAAEKAEGTDAAASVLPR